MVICPSFSNMRYNKRSLIPYQILTSFICQTRSLTCSNVLRILSDQPEPPLIYDCKVLDGLAIVHCLPTTSISTFHEYADRISIPDLEKQLGATSKLDVVWDTYIPDRLKKSTRGKRSECVRRKVLGETKLPGSWMDFLPDPMNKQELFALLTFKVEEFNWPSTKAVYVTSGQVMLSKGSSIAMQNCNHEEMDTRIVVHVMHALQQGAKTIQVLYCGHIML